MSQTLDQALPFHVPFLYGLADLDTLGVANLPAAVSAMARGGLRWIQLRLKRASGALAADLVDASLEAIEGSKAALWIDDRADLAVLFPLLGVHLGQRDLPPCAARVFFDRVSPDRVSPDRVSPDRRTGAGRPCSRRPLIGFSTHSYDQIRAADADPAVDVVAVGPVFATVSKAGAGPAMGLDLVRRARLLTRKPLVAIGGIDAGRVRSVLEAGADSVAVLGALGGGTSLGACEIEANVRRLRAAVETTT